jgi:hypothetical protein
MLHGTNISSNNATAIAVGDDAWLHMQYPGRQHWVHWARRDHALGNSSVVVDGGSSIMGSMAVNYAGGGVAVVGNAGVLLSGASRVVNNTSMRQAGGRVSARDSAETLVTGQCVLCNNTSLGVAGGGIAVAGQGQLALVGGSVVCNNRGSVAGGGLLVMQNASVLFRNASVKGNVAHGSGGGVGLLGSGSVVVVDSVIANNTSVQQGDPNGLGGGAVAALGHSVVQMHRGTRLLGNRAVGLPGGAFAIGENASLVFAAGVVLSDNTVVANTSSPLVPFGSDGVALEASKLNMQPGVLGQDGRLTKRSRSVALFRRPCGVGEFDGGGGSTCLCCPLFTYSFEPIVTQSLGRRTPSSATLDPSQSIWLGASQPSARAPALVYLG